MDHTQTLSAIRFTLSVREFNADTLDHLTTLLEQAGMPLITMPENHRIIVEVDSFYEPDGDYDLEEERAKLQSGEWGAYTVLLQKQCECGNWNVIESLGGVVVEGSNWDNLYHSLDDIPEQYLRECAAELITEAEAE